MTLYYFKARTITRDGVQTHFSPRTEEEVLSDLKDFYNTYGRLPTYFDFKKALAFGQSFPSSTMCKHFECGWDVLLKKAGLKVERKHVVKKSDKEMLKDLQKIYAKLQRPLVKADIKGSHVASPSSYSRRFGSFANACKKAGVPCANNQDKTIMILLIVEFMREFARRPTAKEFELSGNYKGNLSAATYAAKFGSWNLAIVAAEEHLETKGR